LIEIKFQFQAQNQSVDITLRTRAEPPEALDQKSPAKPLYSAEML